MTIHKLAVASLFGLLSFTTVARSQELFDGAGDARSKEVMRRAAADIEKYRKGDFTLELVDRKGHPIAGKEAVAELVSHQFDFGTNTFGLFEMQSDDPLRRKALETIRETFNKVVICNYWGESDSEKTLAANMEAIDWATANGIRTRFHAVLYNQKWFKGRNYTPEQCRQLMEERLRFVSRHFGKKIDEFDITNEFVSMDIWDKNRPAEQRFVNAAPGFPKLRDPEISKEVYALARKYLPDAKLVCLETQIPSVKNPDFLEIMEFFRGFAAVGGDFDYLGHQCHFYAKNRPYQQGLSDDAPDAFTMAGIEQGLEMLASVGKPVVITEFNGPSRNSRWKPVMCDRIWKMSEEENAAWQINFYRLAFSKPYILGVTRWFHIDNVCGVGLDTGILKENGEEHMICGALHRLIKKEWHTQATCRSDTSGLVSFRGFYGEYRLSVAGYKTAKITLHDTTQGTVRVVLER